MRREMKTSGTKMIQGKNTWIRPQKMGEMPQGARPLRTRKRSALNHPQRKNRMITMTTAAKFTEVTVARTCV